MRQTLQAAAAANNQSLHASRYNGRCAVASLELADTLQFPVPTASEFAPAARGILRRGYDLI